MTKQNKIAAAFILATVALVGGAIGYQALTAPVPATAANRKNITVRADSHRFIDVFSRRIAGWRAATTRSCLQE